MAERGDKEKEVKDIIDSGNTQIAIKGRKSSEGLSFLRCRSFVSN